MPATREQLQARIDALEQQAMTGTRAVQDENGQRIDYASGREIKEALAVARRQLAALNVQPVNTIRFHMTKGL